MSRSIVGTFDLCRTPIADAGEAWRAAQTYLLVAHLGGRFVVNGGRLRVEGAVLEASQRALVEFYAEPIQHMLAIDASRLEGTP